MQRNLTGCYETTPAVNGNLEQMTFRKLAFIVAALAAGAPSASRAGQEVFTMTDDGTTLTWSFVGSGGIPSSSGTASAASPFSRSAHEGLIDGGGSAATDYFVTAGGVVVAEAVWTPPPGPSTYFTVTYDDFAAEGATAPTLPGGAVTVVITPVSGTATFSAPHASGTITVDAPAAVPDPTGIAMFGASLAALGVTRRRRSV